ncbi:MAG: SH3 domain-containing protein, partial [bacterium]|nr:SH3 domain-containing protein [bacterium]
MKKKIPIFLAVLLIFLQLNADLKVTRNGANIRQKPDVSSKVLLNAGKGTLLIPKKNSGDWFYVALPIKPNSPNSPSYGYIHKDDVEKISSKKAKILKQSKKKSKKSKKTKDKIFLMGMGMLRLNWASVKGNDIRFRYSDLGLPTELSTRERASFMVDGTFGHKKY